MFRNLFVLLFVFTSINQSIAGYKIEHLEPAFWWAGMKNQQLQLLVHGHKIADLTPSIDHHSVSVEQVIRTDNPNYLFLNLKLAKGVKPGKFTISFHKGDKKQLSYQYHLLERQTGSAEREGFSPADVIYLITPDRFANGDSSNDQVNTLTEHPDRLDKDGRHGGDLHGVIQHLDYIAGMGFTQIWLNPVLQNNQPEYSYHGYSITDFYQVDKRFGTNTQYRELSAKAKEKGVGLIMDMVLNHAGSEHWWMKDLPSKDWVNNGGKFTPTSHKRESLHDPHRINSDQKQFTDGWFVPTMPDLNQKNPLMATYLIQNSIWWVEHAGLSGIRVDTYSYSDKQFLTQWGKHITHEYTNLNITGEEWSLNPSIVAYWQKHAKTHDDYKSYLPSLIDFPLQEAVTQGLLAQENWDGGLGKIYNTIANDFIYADPYNLVIFPDNHDMSRIYTQLNEDFALYKMALAYFLTTRGIPQLYYGTEILMTNPDSDDHGLIRADFPGGWPQDKVNGFTGEGLTKIEKSAQGFTRQLLNWRKSNPAIHNGKLFHYTPNDGIYTYFRVSAKATVMVIFNKNPTQKTLKLDRFHEMLKSHKSGSDIIQGEKLDLTKNITLLPRSVHIIECD